LTPAAGLRTLVEVRALVLVLAVAAGLAAASAAASGEAAPSFRYGVAAGEITPTSAKLWTRAPHAGRVALVAWPAASRITLRPEDLVEGVRPRLSPVKLYLLEARVGADLTVQRVVAGLRPGTAYRYAFVTLDAQVSGAFRTAPPPTADARVRFAVTGDADATPGPSGRPAYNRFETYARMARERNDFNINLGDTIYSDSGVGGARPALTVAAKRAKYRLGLALPALRSLRSTAGLYSHWDDHEFVNDFSRPEHGEAIYRAGVTAFTDYAPVTYSSATGLYRTFRWGRHVELFFLDERSFRSAKADRACGGDLAPTVPAAVRQAFATIAPALVTPVAQACLQALSDPGRTMLGARQLEAFTRAVRGSNATFKVVVNEVPLLQLYALPYDRWEGYAAERARVVEALTSAGNVVVLTTDTHAHLIGEIRTSTLEGPVPVGTGVFEVVTGPVATNTYAKEIERFLGAPGAGALVNALFFKPPPPRGLGLQCAATDQFGYAQVAVTAATLTVTPRTPSGAVVRDSAGQPCSPLVVRAR
jgi:alkaline phosphatase D